MQFFGVNSTLPSIFSGNININAIPGITTLNMMESDMQSQLMSYISQYQKIQSSQTQATSYPESKSLRLEAIGLENKIKILTTILNNDKNTDKKLASLNPNGVEANVLKAEIYQVRSIDNERFEIANTTASNLALISSLDPTDPQAKEISLFTRSR